MGTVIKIVQAGEQNEHNIKVYSDTDNEGGQQGDSKMGANTSWCKKETANNDWETNNKNIHMDEAKLILGTLYLMLHRIRNLLMTCSQK